MKTRLLSLALVAFLSSGAMGQDCGCGGGAGAVYSSGFSGSVPVHHLHPHPVYAQSRAGEIAAQTHAWNQQMAAGVPWHGGHSYWRWGVPTALVVPPTSAYQTEYNWGVAQTRSFPIYHQFGRNYSESGGGEFPPKPYWPSSTNQFGVYPVRAPF
jgi:hypothetical protein